MNQCSVLRNIAIRIESNPSGDIRPRISSENDQDDFSAISVKREFEFTSEEYKDDGGTSGIETTYKLVIPARKTGAVIQDGNIHSAVETSYQPITPISEMETATQDSSFLQGALSAVGTVNELLTPVSETEATTQDADLSQRVHYPCETSYKLLTIVDETEGGLQNVRSAAKITSPQTSRLSSSEIYGCVPCTVLSVGEELNEVSERMEVRNRNVSSLQREAVSPPATVSSGQFDSFVPYTKLTIKSEKPVEQAHEKMNVVRLQSTSSFPSKAVSHAHGVVSDGGLGNRVPRVRSAIKQENLVKETVNVVELETQDQDQNAQEKVDSYSVLSESGLDSRTLKIGTAIKEENLDEDIIRVTKVKTVPLSGSVLNNGAHSSVLRAENTIKQNFDRLTEVRSQDESSPQEKCVLYAGSMPNNESNNYVPHPKMVINQKWDKQIDIKSPDEKSGKSNIGRNCVPQLKSAFKPKVELADIRKSQNTNNSLLKAVQYTNELSNQDVNWCVSAENVTVKLEKSNEGTEKQTSTTDEPINNHSVDFASQERNFSDESAPTKVKGKNDKTDVSKSSLICKVPRRQDDEFESTEMPIAFLYEPNTVVDITKIPLNLTSSAGILKDVVVVMPESIIPVITGNALSGISKNSIPVSEAMEISIPVVNDTKVSGASGNCTSIETDEVSSVADNPTSLIPVDEWTMCSGCSSPFQSPPSSKKLTIFRSDEPPGLCKHCCARLKRANYLYSHMNKITCRGIWSPYPKRTKRNRTGFIFRVKLKTTRNNCMPNNEISKSTLMTARLEYIGTQIYAGKLKHYNQNTKN